MDFLIQQGKSIGANVIMQEVDPGTIYQPTFTLDMHQAQILIDDLWAAGLRPTEGAGSAGAMRATERHLEDMRTLVFKRSQDVK